MAFQTKDNSTIAEELAHLEKMRAASVTVCNDLSRTPDARFYHEGKKDALDSAISSLIRLQSIIGKGGVRQ
ncbi:hypothetical protein DES53_102785 [Roseimicrobium gellanilyticum]|uniref:Uncharacterized protein n=1 Tax=Roseimicrobium gellanilyticum TaxID=748857 RepID=A0A366HU01_9BACT|nr:hypothetical protein [Roseimicrobium gellanilyticum]RBP46394.1 hypothetical protein DES53_102785 [Roseimicrobium gellanilyticum]